MISLAALAGAHLPDHCTPTTPFLETLSAYTHVCIPTPLAFLSSLLGTLSIFSWLFAQLPQILRNYRNQSTAGLSLFFLVEWNLGDLSNLFGALLTNQATWQVIIGGYYCFVDICLVLQWVWYEWLKHGRPLQRIRLIRSKSTQNGGAGGGAGAGARDIPDVVEPYDSSERHSIASDQDTIIARRASVAPQDIPTSKSPHVNDMFSTPVYGTMSPSASLATSPANRTIHRIQQQSQQQSLPNASPRTVLFITLMIAVVAARASPIGTDGHKPADDEESWFIFDLGTFLSWCSTALYLLSRLPQLFLNYRRKSTSGLSPKMFAAAFMGNLLYSSSLATNPLAWNSYGPYGGHGWADRHGSDRGEWVAAALPFFLGAAGVLGLDGTVGLQFWLYGEGPKDVEDSVLVFQERPRAGGKEKSMRVRRVSGWMRGWQPSGEGRITPVIRVRGADEQQPLLGGGGGASYGPEDNAGEGASRSARRSG